MLWFNSWQIVESRTLNSCFTSAAISWAETGLEGAAAGKVGENAMGLKVGLKFSGDGLSKE